MMTDWYGLNDLGQDFTIFPIPFPGTYLKLDYSKGFEPIETLRPSIFVILGPQFDARSYPENGPGKCITLGWLKTIHYKPYYKTIIIWKSFCRIKNKQLKVPRYICKW